MRLLLFAVLTLVFAGCASSKRPELRAATPEEQAKVDAALTPLIQPSGLCRPKEPCAVGLAIEVRQRIHVAAGPASQKKFVLRITTGALRSLQPSELQSALAHELGHIQLGHFESREVRHQAERSTQAAVSGASNEVVRASRASDREEEFAADRYAVELLDRLPGDPGRGCTDMLLLLERLDLEQLTPGWANWLSTHPTAAARLQTLQAECDKKP
ncbi:MAG: M48 family metalloprotease [Candidatus Rokubacteria bacterium]|nr:M48 family metalloprotease [Candidatus Rokubacteria bacterium]